MKTNYEIRYAAHPEDAKSYDTKRIRRDFLIEKVFSANEVNMVYSMYDRMVVGGAMPVGEVLKLEAIDPLKAPFFLTRREMGIFNVGGPGVVKAGNAVFELDYKEALYLGSGDREVTFESKDEKNPAKFYFNSLTAHRNYPDKKVTKADAVVAEMGSLEGSNHRNINKMLVNQVLPTCQLQMGMDLQYLRVYAVDSRGRVVPTATNELTFEVSGEATITATDNGDHFTDNLFINKNRKLHQGFAMVILRSTQTAGKVKVKVSSKELKGVEKELLTK